MPPAFSKPAWRTYFRMLLQDIPPQNRIYQSLQVCEHINDLIAQKFSHFPNLTVLTYANLPTELSLDFLINQYDSHPNITLALPYIEAEPGKMTARRFSGWKNCVTDRFNIRGPQPLAEKVPASKLNIILIPGYAFNQQGQRLGKGGGYYDRFLESASQALKIGVGFDEQWVGSEKIPVDDWDIIMDQVITPSFQS